MQNYPTKKRLAFTLIELIGVIAIIAILAAFLIPRIIEVIRDASVSQTIAAVNNVRSASAAYMSKNGSFPVGANFDTNLVAGSFLDKPFTSKLGTAPDIKVVAGNSATAANDGYWDLNSTGAGSNTTSADTVVVAVVTGVSARDAKKLQEMIDSDTTWDGVSADTKGKVKASVNGSGGFDIAIYVTQ
jgi:prepilin-type N-terminal cleavage/methylation domain-containing protein